jgi:hypothetical protein
VFSRRFISALAVTSLMIGCASTSSIVPENRNPAGTGDIGSSVPDVHIQGSFDSYKLELVRDGKKSTKVAYRFWSGEWPSPIIDIQASQKKAVTKVQAYKNLRDPQPSDKIQCTIKNGFYHPWSKDNTSAILYYTLVDTADYKVVREVVDETNTVYPVGAKLLDVVYYAENYCGAILKIGKNMRAVTASCPFFESNPGFVRTSKVEEPAFREQWIYLSCEEKDSAGKNLKAFVQDTDLLKQTGQKTGCPISYGSVGACK